MTARKIVLILMALAITAGTVIFVRNWVNDQKNQVTVSDETAGSKGPMVLVAKVDVPKGVFIQPSHLRWTEWPDEKVPESYYTNDIYNIEDMVGSVSRRGFAAGDPVIKKRIIMPGDRGFLAAVLRPGFRAMAIRVDATSGVSGLVFPGDRVDLIVTHEIEILLQESIAGRDRLTEKVSETVFENVRVLGIDQFIDEADGTPRIGKNVTLEITPAQAEALAVTSQIGTISLSLHSLALDEEELERLADFENPVEIEEIDPERGETFTFASDVSNVLLRTKDFEFDPDAQNVSEPEAPKPVQKPRPVESVSAAPKPKKVEVSRGADTSVLNF